MNEKKANIRNSTAEFLILTRKSGQNSIEVWVAENTVWLTQKSMSTLFEVTVPTINQHLSNLFIQKEIFEKATIRNFLRVQKEEGQLGNSMLPYIEEIARTKRLREYETRDIC